jgi:hypothetical protein
VKTTNTREDQDQLKRLIVRIDRVLEQISQAPKEATRDDEGRMLPSVLEAARAILQATRQIHRDSVSALLSFGDEFRDLRLNVEGIGSSVHGGGTLPAEWGGGTAPAAPGESWLIWPCGLTRPEDLYENLTSSLHKLKSLLVIALPEARNDPNKPENKLPRRRPGPRPDIESHRKVAQITRRCGSDWQDEAVLEKVCRALDRNKISASKSWAKWTPPALSWERALEYHKERVIKAIAYRLQKAAEKGP